VLPPVWVWFRELLWSVGGRTEEEEEEENLVYIFFRPMKFSAIIKTATLCSTTTDGWRASCNEFLSASHQVTLLPWTLFSCKEYILPVTFLAKIGIQPRMTVCCLSCMKYYSRYETFLSSFAIGHCCFTSSVKNAAVSTGVKLAIICV